MAMISCLLQFGSLARLKTSELQAYRKKPLGHTSATQIVETGFGIFSFHFLDLGMKMLL